jgi:hypothetical protein
MELFVPALEFIFQSIWHFLGTSILLGIIFNGIGSIGQVHHHYYVNESEKWMQFASTKNKNLHEEVSQ